MRRSRTLLVQCAGSFLSASFGRMGLVEELRHLWHLVRKPKPAAPSPTEAPLFAAFVEMSVNDIRRRAQSFESEVPPLIARAGDFEGTRAPDAERGFVPEVLYGHPERPWRDLEDLLRQRKLWQVKDLLPNEQIDWARRTQALSRVFSEPRRLDGGSPRADTRTSRPNPPQR